jgi:hypothetical protein
MVQLLLGLFPQAPFRNVALQCLTEVRRPRAPASALVRRWLRLRPAPLQWLATAACPRGTPTPSPFTAPL